MSIVQGEPLQVRDEGVLTAEYFPLSYVDLSHRFLWRILAPIETVWQESRVPIHDLIGDRDSDGTLESTVRREVESWWSSQAAASLLKPIEKVEVFRVDLVRAPAGG